MKKLSIEDIPEGPYCYTFLSLEMKSDCLYKVKPCPYWEKRIDVQLLEEGFSEQDSMSAYCHYLKEFDALLLEDQCKICGIKDDEEEYFTKTEETRS